MNYENLYNGLTKEAILKPALLGAAIGSGVNYVREKDPTKRGQAAVRGALWGGGIGAGASVAAGIGTGVLAAKLKNVKK